jgi:hypothetical protein
MTAMITAARGDMQRVDTTVAMALGASVQPLTKITPRTKMMLITNATVITIKFSPVIQIAMYFNSTQTILFQRFRIARRLPGTASDDSIFLSYWFKAKAQSMLQGLLIILAYIKPHAFHIDAIISSNKALT